MGNAFLAWEQRLIDELARSSDLLTLEVLGIQFAVRWGPAVASQQRESMSLAWGRCASSRKPLLPSLPIEPSDDQPFSASVAWKSHKHDGGMFQLQAASFEELAENLTSRLTVTAILANAGELTMLHASGVADPATGAVVALVAKSGTGKTTAASVLSRKYGYVTDETVAITHGGSVVPYPKPLSVKHAPGQPKQQVGPDELGLQPAPARPVITSIVLLDRVQSDSPVAPVLQRIPLADAVLALIPDSSSQAAIDEPLQSLCRLIDNVGGVWQVTYSEAGDLPAALEPLFATQPRTEPEWESLPAEDSQPRHLPQGWIQRAVAKDAVRIGGDMLVMLDNELVRLSGIGPAIWNASARPLPRNRLAEEVGKVHGTPEGYLDAVAVATELLVAKSVLKQESK